MLPDDYEPSSYVGPTVAFRIAYDPEREDEALLFARRLFAELDFRIGELTLEPRPGAFDVWLDGEPVPSSSALVVARIAAERLERASEGEMSDN